MFIEVREEVVAGALVHHLATRMSKQSRNDGQGPALGRPYIAMATGAHFEA